MITEIFAHGVHVTECEDAPNEVFVVHGKGWEGDPFSLYLNREEANALITQLGYYVV